MEILDILDAVNARLVSRWPERTVYVDVCPMDFDRPSFWLTVEQWEQSDANARMVRRDVALKVTLYDAKDEHYDASWSRLAQEAQEVTELLTPPLRLGGRALTFQIKAQPREPDAAFLILSTSFLDARPGLAAKPQAPVAESYQLNITQNTKGD